MKELSLYVYNVGHGVCTLVNGITEEGYYYNAVFDCGAMQMFKNHAYNLYKVDTDQVISHMAWVITQDDNYCLDMLVSSHQDIDHNNLIQELLSALNGWDKTVTKDDWIQLSENSIVNGVDSVEKTIILSDKTEYKFRHPISNNTVEFSQFFDDINNSNKNDNIYFTIENFTARYTLNDLETQNEIGFSLFLQAMACENALEFEPMITEAFFNLEITINKISGNIEGRIENVFLNDLTALIIKTVNAGFGSLFNNWNDFGEYYVKNLYNELVQWLNKLNSNYFCNKSVIYKNSDINKILKGEILSTPFIKINRIIMGGESNTDSYNDLRFFLSKYGNFFDGNDTYFHVYKNFTYINYNIDDNTFTPISSTENNYSNIISDGRWLNLSDMDTIRNNATSTVVNLVFKQSEGYKYTVLFPGDVTAHHHIDIANQQKKDEITILIIAPHHGSFDTNIVISGSEPIPIDQQPLSLLYNSIGSQVFTIICECGYNFKYKTPRKEYYDIAVNYSEDGVSEHSVGYFSIDSNSSDFTYEACQIYTTVYVTGFISSIGFSIDLMRRGEPTEFGINTANAPALEKITSMKRRLPPDNMFV